MCKSQCYQCMRECVGVLRTHVLNMTHMLHMCRHVKPDSVFASSHQTEIGSKHLVPPVLRQ